MNPERGSSLMAKANRYANAKVEASWAGSLSPEAARKVRMKVKRTKGFLESKVDEVVNRIKELEEAVALIIQKHEESTNKDGTIRLKSSELDMLTNLKERIIRT